jgi:HK97 family phage portal protein
MGALESTREWVRTFRASRVVTLQDSLAPGIEHDPRNGWNLTASEVRQLLEKVGTLSSAELYRTQPNLRAAIAFLARNVAQLGLHEFRASENEGRERVRRGDSKAAAVLADPSPVHTTYELVYSIVSDLALFDECWLWLTPVSRETHSTGYILRPLPVAAVQIVSGSEWTGDLKIEVHLDENDDPIPLDQSQLVHIVGWSPAYGSAGTPAIDSLRGTLQEQIASQAYRLGVWKNGGQAGSYIYRPKDAPEWGPKAKGRFVEGMREYKAQGAQRGGMPILEDGMEIKSTHLNAKEEQWVEAAQLSLETVCRAFHINPAMLGATGGVTYANMREFRKGLYGETLGPILEQIQQKITARLLPMLGDVDGETYVEFNLRAKLAGDFEAEGAVLAQAVGGPYMKLNEARARQNLPKVEGGDDVLAPLNMISRGEDDDEGGPTERTADELAKLVAAASTLIRSGFTPDAALAAVGLDPIEHMGLLPVTVQKPRDENGNVDQEVADELKRAPSIEVRDGKVYTKATPTEDRFTTGLIRGVITAHAERQRRVVLARLNAKAGPEWWDEERWNRELADDLFEVAVTVTQQVGGEVARELGFTGAYDLNSTLAFLRAVAVSRAGMINAKTREAVEAALAEAEGDPSAPFADLEGARGEVASTTLASTLVAFAGVEAAKHIGRREGTGASKTWLVRSGNPRPEHAKMNGQTVAIDKPFSNGAQWPGDPVLGADGVAGCLCSVAVEVEL